MSPDRVVNAHVVYMTGTCWAALQMNAASETLCGAVCRFDQMKVRWINNATLEVTYPAAAKVVGTRDERWSEGDRSVTVRYVTA